MYARSSYVVPALHPECLLGNLLCACWKNGISPLLQQPQVCISSRQERLLTYLSSAVAESSPRFREPSNRRRRLTSIIVQVLTNAFTNFNGGLNGGAARLTAPAPFDVAGFYIANPRADVRVLVAVVCQVNFLEDRVILAETQKCRPLRRPPAPSFMVSFFCVCIR